MAGSPFFARIKRDVMAIAAAIPEGRVVSYRDIGSHLDVVPRHVAYILSQLSDAEKLNVPWHRVVGEDGRLGVAKWDVDGTRQSIRLIEEGHTLDAKGVLAAFDSKRITVAALPSGVEAQKRPVDAPRTRALNSHTR